MLTSVEQNAITSCTFQERQAQTARESKVLHLIVFITLAELILYKIPSAGYNFATYGD